MILNADLAHNNGVCHDAAEPSLEEANLVHAIRDQNPNDAESLLYVL